MKKILVPTDFSEVATNALKYAWELAKLDGSSIVLFHAYEIPYPTSPEASVIPISLEEMEDSARSQLVDYANKQLGEGELEVSLSCEIAAGFVTNEVLRYANEHPINLIVMGITGGGKMKEILIGSNVMGVLRHCHCDLLIVPKDASFQKPKHLAFATDLNISDLHSVETKLKGYLDTFHAELDIVHVEPSDQPIPTPKMDISERLDYLFTGYRHSLKMIHSNDIIESISAFIDIKQSHLLAVLPKEHGFFDILLNNSVTKKLAFHLHIPILALKISTSAGKA